MINLVNKIPFNYNHDFNYHHDDCQVVYWILIILLLVTKYKLAIFRNRFFYYIVIYALSWFHDFFNRSKSADDEFLGENWIFNRKKIGSILLWSGHWHWTLNLCLFLHEAIQNKVLPSLDPSSQGIKRDRPVRTVQEKWRWGPYSKFPYGDLAWEN